MRPYLLSLVTLTAALAITGCGVNATSAPSLRQAANVAAQAKVSEGDVAFNKQVVYKTIDVLGIGNVYEAKLEKAGIKNINQLLLAGAKRNERKKLAEATGISEKLLLTWINHGDLMRVTGAGPEYSRLLELAGVDTVLELAKRNSIHLAAQLEKANDLGGGKKAVHRIPDVTTTTRWVDNAQKFARIVTY